MPYLELLRVISWIAFLLLFLINVSNTSLRRTVFTFEWREADAPDKVGQTVWSVFPNHTKYFEPSSAPFMINYRVENLDRALEQLRAEGVEIDERIEEYEYGRFAWIMDPEGNKIELWEPLVPFAAEHS